MELVGGFCLFNRGLMIFIDSLYELMRSLTRHFRVNKEINRLLTYSIVYDKLLGTAIPSANDNKNETERKASSLSRTRRLLVDLLAELTLSN